MTDSELLNKIRQKLEEARSLVKAYEIILKEGSVENNKPVNSVIPPQPLPGLVNTSIVPSAQASFVPAAPPTVAPAAPPGSIAAYHAAKANRIMKGRNKT